MNLDKLVRAAIMLSRLLADFVKPVINRLKPCRIAFQCVTGAADGGSGLGKLGIGAFEGGFRVIQNPAGIGGGLFQRGEGAPDGRLRAGLAEDGVIGDTKALADPADIRQPLAFRRQSLLCMNS